KGAGGRRCRPGRALRRGDLDGAGRLGLSDQHRYRARGEPGADGRGDAPGPGGGPKSLPRRADADSALRLGQQPDGGGGPVRDEGRGTRDEGPTAGISSLIPHPSSLSLPRLMLVTDGALLGEPRGAERIAAA